MKSLQQAVFFLGLCLPGAGAALANNTATTSSTDASAIQLSPHEALLSDAIHAYLVKALGSEDALMTKLQPGLVLLPSQTLQIVVPGKYIVPGKIAFGKGTQFQVLSRSDGEENCNGSTSFRKTVQVYSSATVGATYSKTKADSSSTTHAVSVNLSVGDGVGQEFAINQFQAGYSFSDTYGSGTSSEAGGSMNATTSVLTQTDIVVDPGQFVSVQNEVVTLTGNNSLYTGTAKVNADSPIDFYLNTTGFNLLYAGMDMSRRVAGWGLSLNANNTSTQKPYAMGNRVIFSADGAFVFGRETDTTDRTRLGTYSVINLVDGTRLWAPVTNNCGMQHELYVDTFGHFYIMCGNTKVWDAKTDNASQMPCHFLTFIGDRGELGCLRQNPAVITSADERNYVVNYPTWRSGKAAVASMTSGRPTSTRKFTATLRQIANVPAGDVSFRFQGLFSGQLQVSGPSTCILTYKSVPDPITGACVTKGLLGVAGVDANGKHLPASAPPGSVFSKARCPSTQRFLEANHQANGLMVAQ